MYVAPEAELDSGSMDVVAFRDVGVFDATLLPRMYTGSHQEYKKVGLSNLLSSVLLSLVCILSMMFYYSA